jgi:hypothetical protein
MFKTLQATAQFNFSVDVSVSSSNHLLSNTPQAFWNGVLQQLPSSQLSSELAHSLSLPYSAFFQLSFSLSLHQFQHP